jgi:hypothetical protein
VDPVVVTEEILLQNADCAEDFGIAALEGVEPGSVMVIGDDSALRESEQAYDKRVAGIALLGKVWCKVDATRAPVEVGDLLTTSLARGHALLVGMP